MTNQSENLKKLNRMEQEMNFLLKNSENAIFTLDNQGKFLKVSQSFERLIGYLPNYLIDVVRDIDVPEVKSYVKKVGAGHASTLKIHLFLESGSIPVTIQIEPIYENEKVIGGIGIIHKTFLKQKGKDELTELPNRRSLLDLLSIHIQEARAADEKLAIMFIDLDRFKHVNDTLGHEWGDSSLKIIANRLKSIVEQGNIVTRVGGDEFIVIKPQLQSANEVVDLAICLLKEIRRPVMIDQYEFTLTGSIGIAIYPENAKNVEALIKAADVALYQAKLIGSDTYNLYKHEMRLDIHEKFHIENDLRRALEKNEFSLLFQPQYHIATNQYCGEEVLVRWDHPLEGLISPDRFITIAEETGLITSIGKWVLQQACLQKKIWIEKGLPEVPISVNLSLRQFLQQSIVEMVAEVLEESELPPHLLKIEVTESVMIDLDRTSTVVKQLLALGVKISLDDFGTGYSSLQYINQLPVHELKIDQTFVAGIGKGKQAEEIISMIIQLAHSLSISVVAEGVETKEQLLYLTQNNCHKIQGYYYSKPLTGNDFELFMNGLQ